VIKVAEEQREETSTYTFYTQERDLIVRTLHPLLAFREIAILLNTPKIVKESKNIMT